MMNREIESLNKADETRAGPVSPRLAGVDWYPRADERVKVLYIGGYGRSGSTLLVRLLGQLAGFHAVGEMWNIWQRSFIENELCGCGAPFQDCPFWRAVIERAFGGWDGIDLGEICTARRALQGQSYLPALLYPQLRTARQQRQIDAYLSVLKKLYVAIQSVSGNQIIIDSSKGPRYAALLNEIPEIDLRVVHLVRDSRAVVYSWQKKMIKPEVYWKTAYMDRPNPLGAAMNWLVTNWLTQSLGCRDAPRAARVQRRSLRINAAEKAAYLFVRYEDLIESPRTWLANIVRFATEDVGEDRAGGEVAGNQAESVAEPAWQAAIEQLFDLEAAPVLAADHTAVGNPNRFRQGRVELRRDDEWQRKMSRAQMHFVTTMTLPLLRQYGYL